MKVVCLALVAALLLGTCSGRIATPASAAASLPAIPVATMATPPSASGAPAAAAAGPTLAQLVGQKLVVRMDGTTPSADLLGRIRRGEVGGVILFGFNITTRSALTALTAKLRGAATAGGQPSLLIAVDQEGGTVNRIPWAPPTMSAQEMGTDGRPSTARSQGANTGAALAGLGIDVDLAPVADVPGPESFMAASGRTFSSSATLTTTLADAFATGLESKGVLPTLKHFPGIGLATRNTDAYVVTITASLAALAPGLRPYRTAIRHEIPLVMLSNATYTALDSHDAAGWSHAIAGTLLRGDLGFTGVTITDSLDGAAHARGLSTKVLAVRAARAGTDLILTTGSEATSRAVYAALLHDATDGSIPGASLQASYDRIIALKAGL